VSKKPCTDPTPILDDWTEAMKLAAEMDAAARESTPSSHDPPCGESRGALPGW
jgi:hypothetical protein